MRAVYKPLWDRLESGQGTKAELDEYAELEEAREQCLKVYMEGYRMTRRAGLVESAAQGQMRTLPLKKGRPRWYRPNTVTRRRMIQNSRRLRSIPRSGGLDKSVPSNNEGSGVAGGNNIPSVVKCQSEAPNEDVKDDETQQRSRRRLQGRTIQILPASQTI